MPPGKRTPATKAAKASLKADKKQKLPPDHEVLILPLEEKIRRRVQERFPNQVLPQLNVTECARTHDVIAMKVMHSLNGEQQGEDAKQVEHQVAFNLMCAPKKMDSSGLFGHVPYDPLDPFSKKDDPGATPVLHASDGTYTWSYKDPMAPDFDKLPDCEKWNPLSIFGARAVVAAVSEAVVAYDPAQTCVKPSDSFLDINAPGTIGMCLKEKGMLYDADEAFGLQRFQGANPGHVRRVSKKFLDEQKLPYSTCTNGEHLLLDFSHLSKYETLIPNQRLGPRCVLLYSPQSHQILPRAIDLGNGFLVSADDKDNWKWRYAKLVVQCAEFTHQEILAHLTQAHLTAEVFIMETMRAFRGQSQNPIYRLLLPCFSRTLAVNKGARDLLIPWIKSHLTMLTFPSVEQLIQDGYKSFSCENMNFATDLEMRGFDANDLPANYFYAQDGLKIWNAMLQFVQKVLGSTKAALNWTTISQWAVEIRKRLPTFPMLLDKDVHFNKLVEMVAGILFLVTVKHSSLNDPQYYFLGFGPNAPAKLLKPVPKTPQEIASCDFKRLYFESLPSVQNMTFQRDLVSLLALGNIGNGNLKDCLKDYQGFVDPAILAAFDASLQTISKDIELRNEYTWLSMNQATRSVIR